MFAMKHFFSDLESNDKSVVNAFKAKLLEQINGRESWVINGICDYYMLTNSTRAVEVLVSVKEPHEKALFDRLYEGIRSETKYPSLELLSHIIRKHPMWLFNISKHPIFKEILRLLKIEKDMVTVISTLLILNVLIPLLPTLICSHLQDMFEIFCRFAAWNEASRASSFAECHLFHLQVALYTLFHRLYGMFPYNFVLFLRKEYADKRNHSIFSHTVKPMLDTVRVNPLLITASKDSETSVERWKNMEHHDIVVSCTDLLTKKSVYPEPSSFSDHHSAPIINSATGSLFSESVGLEAARNSGEGLSVAEFCQQINAGKSYVPAPKIYYEEIKCFDSVRVAPTISRGVEILYGDQPGTSPPEAAIEATPENTPIKDYSVMSLKPSRGVSGAQRSLDTLLSSGLVTDSSTREKQQEPNPFEFTPMSRRSDLPPPARKISCEGKKGIDIPSGGRKGIDVTAVRKGSISVSPKKHKNSPLDSKLDRMMRERQRERLDEVCAKFKSPGKRSRRHKGRKDSISRPSPVSKSPQEDDCSVEASIPSDDVVQSMMRADSLNDFENCELEESGSPCMSGGLHMPNARILNNFQRKMRQRYYSQCNSDTTPIQSQLGLSSSSSPRDGGFLIDRFVRKTQSCPEIKKSVEMSTWLGKSECRILETPDEPEGSFSLEMGRISDGEMISEMAASTSVGVQTSNPYPYECLFGEIFPDGHHQQHQLHRQTASSPDLVEYFDSPSLILDRYIEAAARFSSQNRNLSHADVKCVTDSLNLAKWQLKFEEYRRETHAERNRRLLGRSRHNKTLEECNVALKEQVTILQKDVESKSHQIRKIYAQNEIILEQLRAELSYWKNQTKHARSESDLTAKAFEDMRLKFGKERRKNMELTTALRETQGAFFEFKNEVKGAEKAVDMTKSLRQEISHLQREVLVSGECLMQHNAVALILASKLTTNEAEANMAIDAYKRELEKSKNTAQILRISLDATKSKICNLNRELREKEKMVDLLKNMKRTCGCANFREEFKDMQSRYKKLRDDYNKQSNKILELEHNLFIAKNINKRHPLMTRKYSDPTDGYTSRNSPPSTFATPEECEENSSSSSSSVNTIVESLRSVQPETEIVQDAEKDEVFVSCEEEAFWMKPSTSRDIE